MKFLTCVCIIYSFAQQFRHATVWLLSVWMRQASLATKKLVGRDGNCRSAQFYLCLCPLFEKVVAHCSLHSCNSTQARKLIENVVHTSIAADIKYCSMGVGCGELWRNYRGTQKMLMPPARVSSVGWSWTYTHDTHPLDAVSIRSKRADK
jgi:hypothetical protein